ncbi:hypothetical protein L6452_22300 [Arctium lappa]|uniref:Uncharacterized protein n=1 Tax=Arctium lappa TaxID=4217 RepID=A0ACB9B023_ARCLA|nr:hypothetical protein L6452_22300 [Arctium lappa]
MYAWVKGCFVNGPNPTSMPCHAMDISVAESSKFFPLFVKSSLNHSISIQHPLSLSLSLSRLQQPRSNKRSLSLNLGSCSI